MVLLIGALDILEIRGNKHRNEFHVVVSKTNQEYQGILDKVLKRSPTAI